MELEIITGGSGLKCFSCYLEFDTSENYKAHFKSDFHRYNLKRRMLDLPPASFEEFQRQFLNDEQKSQATSVTDCLKCTICKKEFGSHQTYKQHLQSKKHAERAANYKQGDKEIEIDYIQSEQRPSTLEDLSICLFCDSTNHDLTENIRHMEKAHGFFILEEKYLKDTAGLILSLAQQINVDLLCPFCQNAKTKGFSESSAVKKHMIEKRHCFMNSSFFFELYCEFYDFRSAIEEAFKNSESEKETVIALDSAQEDAPQDLIKKKEHQKEEYLNYKMNQIESKATLNSRGEVELPSGKVLGHRSMSKYYDQYYRPIANTNEKTKALLGQDGLNQHKLQVAKLEQSKLEAKLNDQQSRRSVEDRNYTGVHSQFQDSIAASFTQNRIQQVHVYQGRI